MDALLDVLLSFGNRVPIVLASRFDVFGATLSVGTVESVALVLACLIAGIHALNATIFTINPKRVARENTKYSQMLKFDIITTTPVFLMNWSVLALLQSGLASFLVEVELADMFFVCIVNIAICFLLALVSYYVISRIADTVRPGIFRAEEDDAVWLKRNGYISLNTPMNAFVYVSTLIGAGVDILYALLIAAVFIPVFGLLNVVLAVTQFRDRTLLVGIGK